MKKNKKLLYDVHEKPPIGKWLILSLQHVFAMFGATILVPRLVNAACGATIITPAMALITSGIGTIIYLICTKGKSPMYFGSSFAFITPMCIAYSLGGRGAVLTGMMATGLLYIILGIIVKFVGNKWIDKLFPPVVVGPMIMIIGLSLSTSAIDNIGLSAGAAFDWRSLLCAFVAFLVTALVALIGKKFIKIIPFLIGIGSGYILAIHLGLVDFSAVFSSPIIADPGFFIPFKDYALSFEALWTMLPVGLVTLAEHVGDHKVVGQVIEKDLIKDPGLHRTLIGDGAAELAAALIGGPASTTYGENTSVVGMTKVASVWVIGLAAVMAILMGFSGQVIAIIDSIPTCVLGGVSILLYGFIAVNGLKVLIENQVDFSNNRNLIIASAMLVFGLGGATISITSGSFNASISGMSLAAIIGVLLNLLLPKERK